jgi:membrane associated rhomboid family serine protease
VQALPEIYEGRTIPLFGVDQPLWYGLQILSTVVGGLLVAIYFLMMKAETGVFNKPRIVYWILLVIMMALIVYVRMIFYTGGNLKYVVHIITACSAFCIGITILGLIPFKRREITR